MCHYRWTPLTNQQQEQQQQQHQEQQERRLQQQQQQQQQQECQNQAAESSPHSANLSAASSKAAAVIADAAGANVAACTAGTSKAETTAENKELGSGIEAQDQTPKAGMTDRPGGQAGLTCVAEERFSNISLVQDVVQDPGTKQRLVCGFKVPPAQQLSLPPSWECCAYKATEPKSSCSVALVYSLLSRLSCNAFVSAVTTMWYCHKWQ